jgi:hypothetical protein
VHEIDKSSVLLRQSPSSTHRVHNSVLGPFFHSAQEYSSGLMNGIILVYSVTVVQLLKVKCSVALFISVSSLHTFIYVHSTFIHNIR